MTEQNTYTYRNLSSDKIKEMIEANKKSIGKTVFVFTGSSGSWGTYGTVFDVIDHETFQIKRGSSYRNVSIFDIRYV